MADSATVRIETAIIVVRAQRVMLASDLARIYGVETRVLNQAVQRNIDKFPEDFMFRLTRREAEEIAASRSQSVILKRGQNVKYLPVAFTEHGALMAANVLRSRRAVQMSVYVIRAFVRLREHIAANHAILKRLAEIDKTLLQHDTALRDIYRKLLPLLQPLPETSKRKIGFVVKETAARYGRREIGSTRRRPWSLNERRDQYYQDCLV
jgi:phage regulator Rha-like protein